jgi:Tol biopolymer transport system component
LLAFLAKDSKNMNQIFAISPNGGGLKQITFHESNVEGSIRWHPSGKSIFYIWNGSICEVEINNKDFNKRLKIISKPINPSPSNLVLSHEGKILAFNRLIENPTNGLKSKQIFLINLD